LESLETLHLYFNNLDSIPDEIGHLYSLTVLFLAYNNLTSLPDLSGLELLQELFLAGNKLGEIHESIWKLYNLRQLFLQCTGLEGDLPELLGGLTSLEILDISGNSISSIPSSIQNLELLSRLNASHNQLSTLPESIDELRELEELDLTHNLFTGMPSAMEYAKDRVEVLLDKNPFEWNSTHAWKENERHIIDGAEMLGRRPTMEDAFSIHGKFMDRDDMDYYGLFDGHAGRIAATFVAEHLHPILAQKLLDDPSDPLSSLAECFPEVNLKFKEWLDGADSSYRHAGTTGVACLIEGDELYLADVGDSRAVLDRDGQAIRLSFDHKPSSEEEEQRIRALGGYVIGETGRVNGQLAVSRSLGDFYMQPFVSDEPYVNSIKLDRSKDRLLILGCDGVWDEVGDQEAIDLVKHDTDPFIISAKLRDYAYLLGSDDNISVFTIIFKDFDKNKN